MLMKNRIVLPELLDTFPDDHPDAIRSRQDLQVVNHVMGNHRWIMHVLRHHYQPGWRITEIGAGDGALSLRLLKDGLCAPQDLHAFDLARRPAHWPSEAAWTQGDVLEQPLPDSEILIANLLLHQFTDDQLALLGSHLSPRTRLFIAAEPARSPIHSFLGRLLCTVAQFHPVTRYDMQISIRAGFRGQELGHALRLGPDWECASSTGIKGAYHFLAKRTT
jgi:hypothetical protein